MEGRMELGPVRARITLTVADADTRQDTPGELAALQDWLTGESRLRGQVRRERPAPNPHEMGAFGDVLVAALGDGGAIAALAGALATWLVTRRGKVSIKVTGPDGRSVEVDARSTDVESLLRTVLPLAVLPEPRDGSREEAT
jgi:Effector Associated Constant Component 1